jgi:TolB protein
MNADGSGARQLTRFSATDGSPQWPAWSPDGSRLAIQSGNYNRQNPSENTAHVWLIDVKGGAATRLNPHNRPYLDETPSWFPDGKRIAFQSDRSGRMEVWVMNADGSGATQVTK